MKRLRVLVSAYACEPDKGSEPGVGWNWVMQIARFHEVWVITRANNRQAIEQALATQPLPQVHWSYIDLPPWARWWKRGVRGVYLYYYLWQGRAYCTARHLHAQVSFDVVHHLTFGNYWMPSWLALLPVPFVWGPVGGGESTPRALHRTFHARGRLYERIRSAMRWLGEHDPLVRLDTRRAVLILAKAPETAYRLRRRGAQHVQLCPESGLTPDDFHQLSTLPLRHTAPFRLVSIGRLVHWKGFALGITAFARLQQRLPASEYWIIGDGAERHALMELAQRLGVADKMRFWGTLTRREVLPLFAACDVLVHPSLHDSGGWVCPEAMAAGRPVICLDLGGPALQVTADTGIKVPARHPEQVVGDLEEAMFALGSNVPRRVLMGVKARKRAQHAYVWSEKGPTLARLYEEALDATP